ncbi:hypothetical protein NQ176_g8289 [Zarea fungicola]|uniref:Uncharacterized protein n=1 Tax=Zarea fungicola TaxID=93591 RepID=A0ACC1MU17_9HYPO|nr:hypothetical protein NQ176_g8289 [Lecanicillium fungicola]
MTVLDTFRSQSGQAFLLRAATIADAAAMAQVCMESFAASAIARGMHGPTGYSEAGRASMQATIEKDISEQGGYSVPTYVVAELMASSDEIVATPTSESHENQNIKGSSKIIGVSKWHFNLDATHVTKVPPTAVNTASRDEEHESLAQVFFSGCYNIRERYIQAEGLTHTVLSILAVSPAAQGFGAGYALLRWGTSYASRNGWACWLTSTPVGYRVYQKIGFKDIDVVDFNLSRWGLCKLDESEDWGEKLGIAIAGVVENGWYRQILMKLPASG